MKYNEIDEIGDSFEKEWNNLSFQDLRVIHDQFIQKRRWTKFHTPRNVLLALVGEIGEICELFQWRDEVEYGLKNWSNEDKLAVSEELADVAIYLTRLAHLCGIDIAKAILRKMKKNEERYPEELVKGKCDKYTTYLKKNSNYSSNKEN